MNPEYLVLAQRIQQDLNDIKLIVSRAERAIKAMQDDPQNQDLFVDAAALNLHDFYAGVERIFEQIVKVIDGSVPSGREWHRDLLHQIALDLPQIRPAVISEGTMQQLDEFLRFRHVVRHIYAFELDGVRVERLVDEMRSTFFQVQNELSAFVKFLNQVGQS